MEVYFHFKKRNVLYERRKMMTSLTQKEIMLLKDEKEQEELCIKKYTKYVEQAQDPQLKQLFSSILQHEQQHLNTINSMLSGSIPSMPQQGQQNQQQNQMNAQNFKSSTGYNQNDKDICQDALATEKYVSSTYNTTIFEFTDHNAREVLNHIQKEEQEHGEQIFNYMHQNGYYPINN